MAIFYAGLSQILVGIQEWFIGNTFGSTVFSSFGGFWLSFGCLYIPQFEILS